eukprot:5364955-Prorocentrum_lima.AAC.1
MAGRCPVCALPVQQWAAQCPRCGNPLLWDEEGVHRQGESPRVPQLHEVQTWRNQVALRQQPPV